MNNFFRWLVVSSANPENVSMTLKGILLQYVGVLFAVLMYFKVPFSQEVIYQFIGYFCAFIGAGLGIFGLARKMYFEIKGK